MSFFQQSPQTVLRNGKRTHPNVYGTKHIAVPHLATTFKNLILAVPFCFMAFTPILGMHWSHMKVLPDFGPGKKASHVPKQNKVALFWLPAIPCLKKALNPPSCHKDCEQLLWESVFYVDKNCDLGFQLVSRKARTPSLPMLRDSTYLEQALNSRNGKAPNEKNNEGLQPQLHHKIKQSMSMPNVSANSGKQEVDTECIQKLSSGSVTNILMLINTMQHVTDHNELSGIS
ncbi:hypothetical protein BJ742DRAFT_733683 [Cladochytrium replicatum]|nr:hypothetical protein BJ742DRAFT_733683 [Cladochytrium replicatum]